MLYDYRIRAATQHLTPAWSDDSEAESGKTLHCNTTWGGFLPVSQVHIDTNLDKGRRFADERIADAWFYATDANGDLERCIEIASDYLYLNRVESERYVLDPSCPKPNASCRIVPEAGDEVVAVATATKEVNGVPRYSWIRFTDPGPEQAGVYRYSYEVCVVSGEMCSQRIQMPVLYHKVLDEDFTRNDITNE